MIDSRKFSFLDALPTIPSLRWGLAVFVVGTVLLCGKACWGAERDFDPLQCDPAQVLGADSCAKCHENEVRQWKLTPHHETFESLHRNPAAKAITKRLGLSTVKRNDTCVQCHYTQQQKGERVRVVAGVSCESCHGAARDWIALHNDYGGSSATKAGESAEHRQQRRNASVAAGMNNPMNMYIMARQCLACHTTPNEQLVNVGGHTRKVSCDTTFSVLAVLLTALPHKHNCV
jgi:hypothetical protein